MQITSKFENEYKSDHDIIRRVAFNGISKKDEHKIGKKEFLKKVEKMAKPERIVRHTPIYTNTDFSKKYL